MEFHDDYFLRVFRLAFVDLRLTDLALDVLAVEVLALVDLAAFTLVDLDFAVFDFADFAVLAFLVVATLPEDFFFFLKAFSHPSEYFFVVPTRTIDTFLLLSFQVAKKWPLPSFVDQPNREFLTKAVGRVNQLSTIGNDHELHYPLVHPWLYRRRVEWSQSEVERRERPPEEFQSAALQFLVAKPSRLVGKNP